MVSVRTLGVGAAGLLCLAGGITGVSSAGADPTLGSYAMSAQAGSLQFIPPQVSPQAYVAFTVPDAETSLSPFSGSGLASIAWPGGALGNLGTLIQVASAQVPPQVSYLNDPVRAQALSGSTPGPTTESPAPGVVATAAATTTDATAEATAGPAAALPSVSFGKVDSASALHVSGATATALATSTMSNLSFAAGAITISSVVSTASATSNGSASTSTGGTTISGMKVAGIPVAVDSTGLHVASSSAPLGSTLTPALNSAVSALGLQVSLSQPITSTDATHTEYISPGLLMTFTQQGKSISVQLGGSSVNLAASTGGTLTTVLPPVAGPVSTDTGSSTLAGSSSGGGVNAPSAGGGSLPSAPLVSAPAGGTSTVTRSPQVASAAPRLRRAALSYPLGIGVGWVLLAMFGSALIAAALKRLPDRVLAQPAVTRRCTDID